MWYILEKGCKGFWGSLISMYVSICIYVYVNVF